MVKPDLRPQTDPTGLDGEGQEARSTVHLAQVFTTHGGLGANLRFLGLAKQTGKKWAEFQRD